MKIFAYRYSLDLPGLLTTTQDASWVKTDGTLKCVNADQVLLLLETSDRVMEDLTICRMTYFQTIKHIRFPCLCSQSFFMNPYL